MTNQWHFDFKDWEEAFKFFYRKRCGEELKDDDGKVLGFRKGNPNLVFVVSTFTYASGYWIEEGAEPDADTQVYKTVEQVKALEQRIKQMRASTVNFESWAGRGVDGKGKRL